MTGSILTPLLLANSLHITAYVELRGMCRSIPSISQVNCPLVSARAALSTESAAPHYRTLEALPRSTQYLLLACRRCILQGRGYLVVFKSSCLSKIWLISISELHVLYSRGATRELEIRPSLAPRLFGCAWFPSSRQTPTINHQKFLRRTLHASCLHPRPRRATGPPRLRQRS